LGLKAAVDFINEIGIDSVESRGRELAAYFHQKLGKDKNIEILTPTDAKCSAAIVTVRIKNKVNQDIRNQLSWENNMPTRLIYENGINGIRLSFAIYNSKEEIDELAKTLVTKANE
jgi:selenocysteine lyase/cysteine desulfurase